MLACNQKMQYVSLRARARERGNSTPTALPPSQSCALSTRRLLPPLLLPAGDLSVPFGVCQTQAECQRSFVWVEVL